MNTCNNCRFHHDTERDNWSGECRRHAPTLIARHLPPGEPVETVSHWPVTSRRDYCGEWSAKDEAGANPPGFIGSYGDSMSSAEFQRQKEQAEADRWNRERAGADPTLRGLKPEELDAMSTAEYQAKRDTVQLPVKLTRTCYVCSKCGVTMGYEDQPCPLCAARAQAEEARADLKYMKEKLRSH